MLSIRVPGVSSHGPRFCILRLLVTRKAALLVRARGIGRDAEKEARVMCPANLIHNCRVITVVRKLSPSDVRTRWALSHEGRGAQILWHDPDIFSTADFVQYTSGLLPFAYV